VRFLIIEDDFVSITKLKTILVKYAECDIATNAGQAFEMVTKKIKDGDNYDLLLVDINLPDMNGLELVKTINMKEASVHGKRSYKIVVTAEGNMFNVKRAAENKCDSFLVKPTRKEVLIEKLVSMGIIQLDDGKDKVKGLQRQADAIVDSINWKNRKVSQKERFLMRQEIRMHKKDIFRMCDSDPKMRLLMEAIVDDEVWREFGEQSD